MPDVPGAGRWDRRQRTYGHPYAHGATGVLFNSYSFILFFGVVVILSRLPIGWRAKKLVLLLLSYIFYASWNPPFVALLWVSTVVDFAVARWIGRAAAPNRRKLLLAVSLLVNLGMLGYFKYAGFMLASFQHLAGSLGWDFQPAAPSIILPIGISFYTFQTLAYTIDVYRRQTQPWPSFLDYALFVTFFPQLVAGPVVRANQFLPQCVELKTASGRQMSWGLTLLVVGLFQKMVVADGLMAPIVETVYGAERAVATASAWAGTAAFAMQIYYDFAGYSTCAIGVALCLGFVLPDNFRCPYAAIGFRDFWARWHITMSTWFRDYVYVALGGSRKGPARTIINLMATMLVCGLWHGARWTFVAWGAAHGVFLIIQHGSKRLFGKPSWRVAGVRPAMAILTFALSCLAWVFFRSQGFGQAFRMLGSMFGYVNSPQPKTLSSHMMFLAFGVAAAALLIHWVLRDRSLEWAARRAHWTVRAAVVAVLIVLILMASSGEDHAFIYFQF